MNHTKSTAAKTSPRRQAEAEPKPPHPKQHQPKPGLEHKLDPEPKYKAAAYRPADKLKGKVALVTGGDSGIGRAAALIYAREGADICVNCLEAETDDAATITAEIEAIGRRVEVIKGDLSDAAFCKELIGQVIERFGQIDILVSNAAYQNRQKSVEEVDDAEFDMTFKTNVYAYFYLVKEAVQRMKPGSAIIVTSSEVAWRGPKELLPYSGTKGAINSMTKVLAKQLIRRGIRVNAVAPGPVWTPLNVADKGATPEKVAEFGKDTPIGRPAQPEELAPAYVFLASEADSSYITGEILAVMGGEPVP